MNGMLAVSTTITIIIVQLLYIAGTFVIYVDCKNAKFRKHFFCKIGKVTRCHNFLRSTHVYCKNAKSKKHFSPNVVSLQSFSLSIWV